MALFNSPHLKTALIATVWLSLAGVLFYFMSSKVSYRPEGYHNLTPYLTVKDGAAAIVKQLFGPEYILESELNATFNN